MGIFHQAFLFKAKDFLAEILPLLKQIETSPSVYETLRSRALDVYDGNSTVRMLASNDGGWDRRAIIQQNPSRPPYNSEDIAFWLTLLLYRHLKETTGLGEQYIFEKFWSQLGWGETEKNWLIYGRSFSELAKEPDIYHAEILKNLKPYSHGGPAGWLSQSDCVRLLAKLETSRVGFQFLNNDEAGFNRDTYEGQLSAAAQMLKTAQQNECDLAIIISG
jgi:hypothetical protein